LKNSFGRSVFSGYYSGWCGHFSQALASKSSLKDWFSVMTRKGEKKKTTYWTASVHRWLSSQLNNLVS